MNKYSILVVDDEVLIRTGLRDYLDAKGYAVTTASCGQDAVDAFMHGAESDGGGFSLVLLDLMLPDIPGEDVCREIRKSSRVPIIMLTAKIAEDDVVEGLRAGADDYMKKPFGLKELLARIETLIRRSAEYAEYANHIEHGEPGTTAMSWNSGDLKADFSCGEFLKNGKPIKLTPTESRLLSSLASRAGRIFTRDELIESAFGESFDGFDRSVDAHIKNLRAKIEDDPRKPDYILTVHGIGYRFGGK